MKSDLPPSQECGGHIVSYRQYSGSHYFSPMAKKRWSNDIAYAMTPFKLLTWPIGVWPLQVFNVFSLIRWITATCCLSVVVIMPALEFQFGCTDAGSNVDTLMLISCGLLAMLKTILFRVYTEQLADNYNSAIDDYLTIEDKEKRVIMRRHAFLGRMLACFMVCFSYFASATYTLISALTDDKDQQLNITIEETVEEYPIPSRCTLEYLNVPASMSKIIRLFEFMAFILTSTSNHGTDALFLNATLHVCGQVKILKTDFTNFDTTSPRVHERFNALIERHSFLMTMAGKLIETISPVMLMQLFFSCVLLCIIGFQLILASKIGDFGMLAKGIVVLSSFIIQLSSYSFVGDYLKSEMEEVGLSIYQSAWYNLPPIVTRNIVFVMMWDIFPVKLLAGNFIVVNLDTYMSIIKSSISYLSVLRVMIET